MDKGLCVYCHVVPVSGRKRKYCDTHSGLASVLWKQIHRRLWRAAGDQYWLSDWKHTSPAERRTYFRNYMRGYRARRPTQASKGGCNQ